MKVILLVEDDDQIADACSLILERAGYYVTNADNGIEAVGALKLIEISLLIVDIFMPGKDGFEVIKVCQEVRPTLPIIAISGGGGTADPNDVLTKAHKMGAVGTLRKPFGEAELVDAVRRAIGPGVSRPDRPERIVTVAPPIERKSKSRQPPH